MLRARAARSSRAALAGPCAVSCPSAVRRLESRDGRGETTRGEPCNRVLWGTSVLPKIFISYRRVDSAYAAHAIYDRLISHFGADSVVFDVHTIPLGANFKTYLSEQVSKCDVLLAVIGERWMEVSNEDGKRRLDNPLDFVRIEIHAALRQKITVIPVLTGNASMPEKATLPRGMKTLPDLNAAEVRSGPDFQTHLDRLIRGLDTILKAGRKNSPTKPSDGSASQPNRQAAAEAPPSPLRARSSGSDAKRRSATEQSESDTSAEVSQRKSMDLDLKLIPAGEFMMGSPESDNSARSTEQPQHPVKLTQPFYLGIHVVTQGQYATVMEDRPWHGREHVIDHPDCPATYVTWDDALAFCRKLGEQDGADYRLPSEAQWEYACRCGDATIYSFGNGAAELGEHAWYDGNAWDIGEAYPHAVGLKRPNPWGIYDMHGNVWEWCSDYWSTEYEANEVTDPTGPAYGNSRVLRGGSFGGDASGCRSAVRGGSRPDMRSNNTGFRVTRTCNESASQ